MGQHLCFLEARIWFNVTGHPAERQHCTRVGSLWFFHWVLQSFSKFGWDIATHCSISAHFRVCFQQCKLIALRAVSLRILFSGRPESACWTFCKMSVLLLWFCSCSKGLFKFGVGLLHTRHEAPHDATLYHRRRFASGVMNGRMTNLCHVMHRGCQS